jgi:DAACS family dicarboxylate/amino acid:cation (Na+ or H+) symporter
MASEWKILLGLTGGAGGGIAANLLWGNTIILTRITYVVDPMGQIFLPRLLMIVLPLIFTSVCLAVARFEEPRELARIGGKTIGIFVLMAALGSTLGIIQVSFVRPESALDSAHQKDFIDAYAMKGEPEKAGEKEPLGIDMLVRLVPATIFDAAARVTPDKKAPVLRTLEGVDRAMELMVAFVMYLAPAGVAALMFAATARFGLSMLSFLGQYLAILLSGLLLYQFVVLGGIAWLVARVRPVKFFGGSWLPILTALAMGSSSATLPTTMRAAEDEFGISRKVVQFVLPLSATMTRGRTALFSVITVLFLAPVFWDHSDRASANLARGSGDGRRSRTSRRLASPAHRMSDPARQRDVYQVSIGYAAPPKSDKPEQFYVRAEVSHGCLRISALYFPCKVCSQPDSDETR